MAPNRDTTLRSGREILCRLLFLVYVAGILGGGILLFAGAVSRRADLALGGVAALAVSLSLHLTRRRWRKVAQIPEAGDNRVREERESSEKE